MHGSWLKAHGSCLKARGSSFMVHGQEKFGAGTRGLGDPAPIFLGHEPWTWATSLEAWAMSLEP